MPKELSMPNEKEKNNKQIVILLKIIAVVALCVAAFVVVREHTKVNASNIVVNGTAIKENGNAIKELVGMRTKDRENALELEGEIKVELKGINIKQEVMAQGIKRIEEKL